MPTSGKIEGGWAGFEACVTEVRTKLNQRGAWESGFRKGSLFLQQTCGEIMSKIAQLHPDLKLE